MIDSFGQKQNTKTNQKSFSILPIQKKKLVLLLSQTLNNIISGVIERCIDIIL